jgi:hypothetical protein
MVLTVDSNYPRKQQLQSRLSNVDMVCFSCGKNSVLKYVLFRYISSFKGLEGDMT